LGAHDAKRPGPGALADMRLFEKFWTRVSNDPAQYALRVVLFLGVLLLVLLLIAPNVH
jgi:formate hydrogenlyase subunit 4